MSNIAVIIVTVDGFASFGAKISVGTVMTNFGFLITHWGRGKIAAISQTIFSNAFSWMKSFLVRLKFQSLKCVPKGPIDNNPAFIWANDGLAHWRMYASLGLNKSIRHQHLKVFVVSCEHWLRARANIEGITLFLRCAFTSIALHSLVYIMIAWRNLCFN